jgi:hypothetical protein
LFRGNLASYCTDNTQGSNHRCTMTCSGKW